MYLLSLVSATILVDGGTSRLGVEGLVNRVLGVLGSMSGSARMWCTRSQFCAEGPVKCGMGLGWRRLTLE